MKKVLTILTVLIVFILVFAGVWWFLMRGDEETLTDTTGDAGARTFNPFGMFDDGTTPTTPDDGTSTGDDTFVPFGNQTQGVLTNISEKAVAGAVFVTLTNGTSTETALRYVERETGHIFDYLLSNKSDVRISNTTIPRIREAIWGNNGSSVALRYLGENETIETFLGTVATSSIGVTNGSLLSGSFLPKNILSLTVHPTLKKTFYLLKTDTGSAGYVIENGTAKMTFSHPFSQWRVQWAGPSSVLLTTAPSNQTDGAVFLLNTGTGTLKSVEVGIPAPMTQTDKDGKNILFAQVGPTGIGVFTYAMDTAQKTPVYIKTLPEKCVWAGKDSLYCGLSNDQGPATLPDSWYQGVVSFSDEIWSITPSTEFAEYILDTSDYITGGADIIDVQISNDSRFLSFINKKDGSLWLVDLFLAASGTLSADNSY